MKAQTKPALKNVVISTNHVRFTSEPHVAVERELVRAGEEILARGVAEGTKVAGDCDPERVRSLLPGYQGS